MLNDGLIEGYASLFGVPDAGGDILLPAAFSRSIARRGAQGIRMLFQHDPGLPIGVWTKIVEDKRGLFVSGQLNLEVQRARELAELLDQRALDGLSIGFRTQAAFRDRNSGKRYLRRVDLWEISIVPFPCFLVPGCVRCPNNSDNRRN